MGKIIKNRKQLFQCFITTINNKFICIIINMAPFKLKFRMGSGSRSVSQEIEEPVQQPLLMRQSAVSGSNTTLSSEYNSMSTNNDQHNLLPNTFEEEAGKSLSLSLTRTLSLFLYSDVLCSSRVSALNWIDDAINIFKSNQLCHRC